MQKILLYFCKIILIETYMLKPVVSYFFILSGIFTGFFLSFIYLIYKFLVRYDIFEVRKLSLAIFPHFLFKLMALNTRVISRKFVRANGQCFGSFRMFKREGKQRFGKLYLIEFNHYQNKSIYRIFDEAGFNTL